MNDRELEHLLRLTAQLKRFESDCGEDLPVARRVGARRLVLSWVHYVATAAAAALVWAALPSALNVSPGGSSSAKSARAASVVSPVGVRVCSAPLAQPRGDRSASYRVQPTVNEACDVFALLRTWSSDCGCLTWEVHRFDDGQTITHAARGEAVDIAGSETAEVVVLAVSRDRGVLPSRGDEAAAVLACLDENSRDSMVAPSATSSATIAASCLPRGVTIVSHRVGDGR